jgi:hypothetical protein
MLKGSVIPLISVPPSKVELFPNASIIAHSVLGCQGEPCTKRCANEGNFISAPGCCSRGIGRDCAIDELVKIYQHVDNSRRSRQGEQNVTPAYELPRLLKALFRNLFYPFFHGYLPQSSVVVGPHPYKQRLSVRNEPFEPKALFSNDQSVMLIIVGSKPELSYRPV